MSNLYIGLMSGTSADGIDAALVEFSDKSFQIHHAIDIPYQQAFRNRLLELALNDACTKSQLATLNGELADLMAAAVNQLLSEAKVAPNQVAAIGSHGHTIDHAPNNALPYSFQITDHARLAEKTGISVICDFRTRDIAAGGQGAPLVPAFHQWLFRISGRNDQLSEKAFINIGGISNITLLNKGLGYDCGPGNCLIDYWHYRHTGQYFDASGSTARGGRLLPELLKSMLKDNYFAAPPPKSTGREYFNQQWLKSYIDDSANWQDISFTLTALSAKIIADQLNDHQCSEAFICGGGSHNHLLLEQIAYYAANIRLQTTTDLGIDPDWMEAAAFAWLARQTLLGLPGNLPSATGAKGQRILGAIYPR